MAYRIAAVLGIVGTLLSVPTNAQEARLRASGSFPGGHTASQGMQIFATEVERLTDGAVEVRLFPDNQLGGGYEQVDQVRTGQIELAWAGPEFYTGVVPELDVAMLPFSAAGSEQAYCLVDGELGEFLAQAAADKGLIILGWMENGPRHVTNNVRPVKTVADLQGLKLRTPPSELMLETFRAVGANPTPLDIAELYQALQQGVVDGQENPYDNMLVRNFDEVQTYLSNTGHIFSWSTTFMNKDAFDSLGAEAQAAIREAMAKAVAEQRQLAQTKNREARDALIQRGMIYDEIPREELASFREATRPVYDLVRQKVGDEAVDEALAAIERCGA
jgi:tripartite ATP-independent transporter DctP family solute receptor